MAGLDEMNREFRPKCPHCHAAIDLREYWKALFQTMLRRLSDGERVRITGFGAFEAKPYGGWNIKGLDGKKKAVPKGRVIRFYASGKAKKAINAER